jgi:hypothetical protein
MSIQVLQNPSGLGRGLSSLGSSLGQGLQQYGQRRQTRKSGNILEELLGQVGQEGGPENLQQVLAQALGQGARPEIVNQFGTLGAALQRSQKSPFEGKTTEEISDLFQKFGMDPQVANRNAELYGNLSVGGQTAFAQQLMDSILRQQGGLFGGVSGAGAPQVDASFTENIQENVEPLSPRADVEASQEETFSFPQVDPFQGLTPKEKVERQAELFKDNSSAFKENQEKLKGFKTAGRSIGQLDNLNNSGKLPKGFGKAINVNLKTGDLRLPSGANPETQLFVKTVNEFIRGAKEAFGARVTNFELDRFLQQLPTLANTEEGRRLILKQMTIVNDLNQLEADSKKEVLNNYGLRNIDAQQVEGIAERMRAPKEKALIQDFYRVPEEQESFSVREKTPQGSVAIEFQGKKGYVSEDKLEEIIRRGGRKL